MLQQCLEKPVESHISALNSSTYLAPPSPIVPINAAEEIEQMPPPPIPVSCNASTTNEMNNTTKYFCFKCKTTSFETFEALQEHHQTCLTSNSNISELLKQNLAADVDKSTSIQEENHAPTRYYKCTSCASHHENWNIFLHLREKHNRHICLYCERLFPTGEKLSLHLEIKHDLEQIHFNSEEALRQTVNSFNNQATELRYLMCCQCHYVFEENQCFSDHNCQEYMSPCPLCGQMGRHSNQCKDHPDVKRAAKTKKKKDKLINGQSVPVPILNCDSNNSSNQYKPTITSNKPPPQQQLQQQPPSTSFMHSEDSNSSSQNNMIIDESATTTTQSWHLTALPNPNTVDQPKLVVPKLKLRVPKEFQKSVDAAISASSESDEDEEDNEDEANTSGENKTILSNSLENAQAQNSNHSLNQNENSNPPNVEDDDSLDEPNQNLVRILAEIERTKMDIQNTKKSFHHPSNKEQLQKDSTIAAAQPLGPPANINARVPTLSQSSNRTAERNWSPTPPASPNSRWFTPRRALTQSESSAGEHYKSDDIIKPPTSLLTGIQETDAVDTAILEEKPADHLDVPVAPVAATMTERRDTVGSDAMDIDESINEHQTASFGG